MAAVALVLGGFTGLLAAFTGLIVLDINWTQAALTYCATVTLVGLACCAVRFAPGENPAAEPGTA